MKGMMLKPMPLMLTLMLLHKLAAKKNCSVKRGRFLRNHCPANLGISLNRESGEAMMSRYRYPKARLGQCNIHLSTMTRSLLTISPNEIEMSDDRTVGFYTADVVSIPSEPRHDDQNNYFN
jgi:hypothetical protein